MLLTSCPVVPRPRERLRNAPIRRAVGTLLVAAGSSFTSLWALAQTTTPPPSEVAPSERAKRDADKVFHWIMIQGDRTRKAPLAGAKDTKDAKDDRPAAKPVRAAAPEATPTRARPDASTAAVAPVNPKPAGKPVEHLAEAPAPAASPTAAVDSPKPDDARLARIEPGSRAAAPAVSDDAPQGLVALAQPAPQFPASVMRALRRGTVQVRFDVLTDGSVANLEVLKTTSARLNSAAIEAVGQWRFKPVSKVQTGAVEVGFDLE